MLSAVATSNEKQIERVIEWVLAQESKRIGVLGLSFKSGTDDLRESPIVHVVETLLGKGCDLAVYDVERQSGATGRSQQELYRAGDPPCVAC